MKTSELTGAQLDYWVARAECLLGPMQRHFFKTYAIRDGACRAHSEAVAWRPSADWAVGGPIIEREGIVVLNYSHEGGRASAFAIGTDAYIDVHGSDAEATGPTHLIAAMRCYVQSKFGKEVPDNTG